MITSKKKKTNRKYNFSGNDCSRFYTQYICPKCHKTHNHLTHYCSYDCLISDNKIKQEEKTK